MEINTFDDIVKLHQEFASRLAERLKAPRGRAAIAPDELMKEKRALLEQTIEEKDELYRAKVEAANRFEAEIERNKETITRLEREIIDYEKAKDVSGRAEPNEFDLAAERTTPTDKAKETVYVPELYTPVEGRRRGPAKKVPPQKKKRDGRTKKKITKK